MRPILYACFAISLALLPACDHDHDHDHGEDTEADADDHACTHIAEGPDLAVTAGPDEDTATPMGAFEHQRVVVTLPDQGEGVFRGFVALDLDEAGEFMIAADRDVPISIAGASAESSEDHSEACTEVKARLIYDLEAGAVTMEIGPSPVATVNMVVVHMDGLHEH